MSWNGYERNVLLRNNGQQANGMLSFTDVSRAVGVDEIRDGRGMAVADFDNDGDLDIVINNNSGDVPENRDHGRPTFLRNELGNRRNWFAVELEGTESNRDGVGALVVLEADGVSQMRHLHVGSGYAAQQTLRLYFGLNDATQVDNLTVRWPSGREEESQNLKANQLVRIMEGSGSKQIALVTTSAFGLDGGSVSE